MNQSDQKLFAALVREAERRMSEFKTQGLANTAWTFAIVKHSDENSFVVLAKATERSVSDFNGQALANTAWVFATVKQPS